MEDIPHLTRGRQEVARTVRSFTLGIEESDARAVCMQSSVTQSSRLRADRSSSPDSDK